MLAVFTPAWGTTDAGLAWLLGHAQPQGSYTTPEALATEVQATSEALHALRAFGHLAHPTVSAARHFLLAEPSAQTEYLARKIMSSDGAGEHVAALREALLRHQNADGGFGDLEASPSTVLDTAFALTALAVIEPGDPAAIGPAVGFLLAQQQTDGRWADHPAAASVALSALAFRALWLHRHTVDVTRALQTAQDFLLAQRRNGVWDETWQTAVVLGALVPHLSSTTPVADSLLALAHLQRPDGSWDHDVYTTALALQALALAAQPVPNPDLGSIHGRVLDGSTGVPLAGVTITLHGGAHDTTLVTGSDGLLQFQGLAATDYQLFVTLTNYSPITTVTTVPVGGTVDLGALHLLGNSTNPTTGTVMGVVTDAGTEAPLAGVTITVNDHTTTTASDGRYQLSNVLPGAIAVTAHLDGYSSSTAHAELLAGGIVVFAPRLTPGTEPAVATLFGTVTDAVTGTPLPHVSINVSGSTTATTHTDTTGAYSILPLTVGTIVVTASVPGYDAVHASAVVTTNARIHFAPALYATATTPADANVSTLTGSVLDATTDQPLAGVAVDATHSEMRVTLHTTADGRFTIAAITGASVALRFHAAGYAPSTFTLPIEPLTSRDIGQVRLRPEDTQALAPDGIVTSIDTAGMRTDPQTLARSGTIDVVVRNQGTRPLPAGFALLAFDDRNDNRRFDADTDMVLGHTTAPTDVAVAAEASVTFAVAGTAPFRDAPISVWVDSAQQVVELDEQNNVTSSTHACAVPPAPITIDPVLKWAWTASVIEPNALWILSAPVVIDLTADGIPEVVFTSYYDIHKAVLRAVDGRDGRALFTMNDPQYPLKAGQALAAGDIDGDQRPEILATDTSSGHLIAFEHDGTVKWRSPYVGNIGAGGPAIADLDADGVPEIIVGATVLNHDGTIRWQGAHGHGSHYPGTTVLSLVANLDMQGAAEIVAGNTAYRADGSVYWHRADLTDGFNAVGNFDTDAWPEIVLVSRGQVYLLEHDGSVRWGPVPLPGASTRAGGAPTVADVDGDGQPEIGIASTLAYTVFETNGEVKWSVPVDDNTDLTGSAAFDFDRDGAAEILHADQTTLRILRGRDGTVLWETASGSSTGVEMPLVVDVDADGSADIVKTVNRPSASGFSYGLFVYEDPSRSWASTCPVWNQHSYHRTNVRDDGTIPQQEEPSWFGHNTYRANAVSTPQALNHAELSVAVLDIRDNGTGHPVSLRVRLGNGGRLTPTQPVTVAFYQGDPAAGGTRVGTVEVLDLPGLSVQDVQLDGVLLAGTADVYAVVDPANAISECNEENNVVRRALTTATPLGQLVVVTDSAAYGPDSPVALTATVTNLGSLLAHYTLQLRLDDHDGILVTTFPSVPITALAGGASVTHNQGWNTGRLLTGTYRVVGMLMDGDGIVRDTMTTAFAINAGAEAGAFLRLTTDRTQYHTTDIVTIAALARNLTTNTVFTGSVVHVQVRNPGGAQVFDTILTVGDLAPHGQRETTTLYRLHTQPEGVYTVEAQFRDASGAIHAGSVTTFTVAEDARITLTGQIVVQSPVVTRGDMQLCTETITNHGTLPLPAQPVRQLLGDLHSGESTARIDTTVHLNPGATTTLLRAVDTRALSAGAYACVVQARIALAWHTIAAAVFTVEEPPFQLHAALTPGVRGRVLILLDAPAHHDTLQGKHTPSTTPPVAEQRAVLDTMLTHAEWSFTIVTDTDSFTRAFRSGAYVSYLLLTRELRLPKQVQQELREAVYRGESLLVAGNHLHYPWLQEALGVTPQGRQVQVQSLHLADSAVHPAAQAALSVTDSAWRVRLTGATTIGTFQPPLWPDESVGDDAEVDDADADDDDTSWQGPGPRLDPLVAVAIQAYGAGTALYMGFNVLAEATVAGDESLFTRLFVRALDVLQPAAPLPLTDAVIPVQLTMNGHGSVPPVEALLAVPAASRIVGVDITAGDATLPTETDIEWNVTLADGTLAALTLWLRLPHEPQPIDLTTLLNLRHGSTIQAHDHLRLTIEMEQRPGLAEAHAMLTRLAEQDAIYRAAARHLEHAMRDLERGRLSQALYKLVQATTALSRASMPEAEAVRAAVAEAIRRIAQQWIDG